MGFSYKILGNSNKNLGKTTNNYKADHLSRPLPTAWKNRWKIHNISFNSSLIKIINLYTPPYKLGPIMRIPMPNSFSWATLGRGSRFAVYQDLPGWPRLLTVPVPVPFASVPTVLVLLVVLSADLSGFETQWGLA